MSQLLSLYTLTRCQVINSLCTHRLIVYMLTRHRVVVITSENVLYHFIQIVSVVTVTDLTKFC